MIDPATAVPRIAGLNSLALLDRLGGDRAQVWEVLARFVRSQRTAAPPGGPDAADAGAAAGLARLLMLDPRAAHARVHALKGVLGTLGAEALFARASALDAVVRAAAEAGAPIGDAAWLAEASAFEAAVARLTAAIADALAAAEPARAPPPTPTTLATSLATTPASGSFAALGEALAVGRVFAAREQLDALRAAAPAAARRDLLERLAALVGAYRLREALALLEAAGDV